MKDQDRSNKLMIVVQKFENFKMKSDENIEKFDYRFTEILNEMENLGKEYSQKERNLNILRELQGEWDMKVAAIRESNDLSKISISELF